MGQEWPLSLFYSEILFAVHSWLKLAVGQLTKLLQILHASDALQSVDGMHRVCSLNLGGLSAR